MRKRSVGRERKPSKTAMQDVALILDRTEDMEGFQVVRRRAADRPLEFGTLRPLQEGKPVDGEVVSLRARKDAPNVYDVKVELPDTRSTGDGPPQVATPEYRKGWDNIWGKVAAASSKSDKLN
jgi:hypothetical protein